MLVAVELLERETSRSRLLNWLEEAESGEGRVVLLGGEAGVGKTSLVREFCRSVGQRGRILMGACDPLSTPTPLEPLLDIADQIGGQFRRSMVQDVTPSVAFRDFLQELQGLRRSTLVVFEDIHWADEATLDLLRFLARRIGASRTLLVATYRDDEVGPTHPLQVALGDITSNQAVRKLVLSPLSMAGVATLAAGTEIDPVELHARTNGNPFYVTEALALGESGVPGSVRDAVLARAGRLTKEGREALEAAAIIGARIEPQLLLEVSTSTAEVVDEPVSLGLLQSHQGVLMFRHELAREAVLQSVPLPKRVSLHKRVLLALESSGLASGNLARLAAHAEDSQDRAAVLRYAPEAARRAASLQAHREAASQYERALRFTAGSPPPLRATLLDAFATEAGLVDRQTDAIDARRQAVAIWHELGEATKEASSLNELAAHCVRAGRNQEAEESSREALKMLEQLPPCQELAQAYQTQGYLRMLNRDCLESVEWCEKALTLPHELVSDALRIETYNTLGAAQLMAGQDEQGVAYLLEGARLAKQAGDERLRASAYGLLGSGSGELYKFERAEQILQQSITIATEHDLDATRLYSLSWLALTQFYLGRWAEAADAAYAVIRRPGAAAVSRIMALIAMARLRLRRGDPEVWPPLDEALALALETNTLQRVAPVRAARAEAALQARDSAKASAEADAAFDLALRYCHPWFVGELAYLKWRAGELHDLPRDAAVPFAMQMEGRWQEAAAAWHELGCPFEEARALAEGNDVGSLKLALRMFETLGAHPAASETARKLRELGATAIPRGPRASTRANPANLTAREMQVLQQLDGGLTDKEIAEALHLSPKTVGHHVSSILSKLQVRNRVEAARTAKRLGSAKDREEFEQS